MSTDCLNGHINRLRGTFALLVMVGHSMDMANRHSLVDYGFVMLMELRRYLGFVWVVGFVVLSGYCIASSCRRAGDTMTARSFVMLRVSRLFPMMWTCLAVAVLVEMLVRGSPARPDVWTTGVADGPLLANVFGLAAYGGMFGSYAPASTLSFELVFYVLWAVVWFGTGRRPARALSLAALTTPVLMAVAHVIPGARSLPFGLDFTMLLFACWLMGAALAFYIDHPWLVAIGRLGGPFRWLFLLAVIVLGNEAFQMPLFEVSWSAIVYYLTLGVAFAFVTVGFNARVAGLDRHALDRMLGDVSYPLYLVHGPVILFIAYLLNRRLPAAIPFTAYITACCGAAALAALLLTIAVERPLMAVRQRLRTRLVIPRLEPAAQLVARYK
jgi:peptidoglycan/LPS O-acetylase OafA/YrhL